MFRKGHLVRGVSCKICTQYLGHSSQAREETHWTWEEKPEMPQERLGWEAWTWLRRADVCWASEDQPMFLLLLRALPSIVDFFVIRLVALQWPLMQHRGCELAAKKRFVWSAERWKQIMEPTLENLDISHKNADFWLPLRNQKICQHSARIST